MHALSRRSTHSPTVSHIVSNLEQRIETGHYLPGQTLPSERALGDEFRVSRVSIRQAIKELEHKGLVVCALRCRPLVRGGEPVSTAPLATARRTVALWIWPNPGSPGPSMIVRGIRHALDHDDFRLLLDSAFGDTQEEIVRSEAQFLQRITQDKDVEGAVLWYLGDTLNLPALRQVREAGLPMVFIDRRPPAGFDADYVGVDNVKSAENAVRHLISLGHSHIAHITNIDTASTVEERHEGYQRALKQAGIPLRPELVLHDTGDGEKDPRSQALVEALLHGEFPATAIFAVNDLVALRAIDALRSHGVRVPEDIAVVGFDGNERWSPISPFLTTVHQPFERIGAHAIDLLLERIEKGSSGAYRHVLLDAPVQVYGSTGSRLQGNPLRDQVPSMRVRQVASSA